MKEKGDGGPASARASSAEKSGFAESRSASLSSSLCQQRKLFK